MEFKFPDLALMLAIHPLSLHMMAIQRDRTYFNIKFSWMAKNKQKQYQKKNNNNRLFSVALLVSHNPRLGYQYLNSMDWIASILSSIEKCLVIW